MSVSNHPSVPPAGVYQFFPSDLYSSTIGQEQNEEQTEGTVRYLISPTTLDPSPIEIWDLSRGSSRLVISDRETRVRSTNLSANICHYHAGIVDRFARDHLNRHLIQTGGHVIRINIYDPRPELRNNACFDSWSRSFYFGEVDSYLYRPFHQNFDILAHECGHSVVYYTSMLKYSGQSGALNESFADIFAIMAKHSHNRIHANAPDADWDIGRGIQVNPFRGGTSLRSMSNPGSAYYGDTQVGHMNAYHDTVQDHGGVHTNSGIPNKAFYLAAKEIGGFSWEKLGVIWHTALNNSAIDDDFSAFAGRTMSAVKDLNYGAHIFSMVGKAWLDVGVDLRRYAYVENTPLSPTLQNLDEAILCFNQNNLQRGMTLFNSVCLEQFDVETAVYKNAWIVEGRRLDVCHEFGRLAFRGDPQYAMTLPKMASALTMYRSALYDYTTTTFRVPQPTFDNNIIVHTKHFCDEISEGISEGARKVKETVNYVDKELGKIFFG